MTDRVLMFLGRPEVWAVATAAAAFLTLFWVIRGAPIGQAGRPEPAEAPSSGYRDRVVASAVIGFLLVLAGAFLAVNVGIAWSIPAFAAGFGLVMAVLKANRRYRHVSPTLRRTLEFADTALTASLVAGILLVGNVLAFRYGGRAIDLTHDRAFSLSSMTVNQLKTLDRPISFAVYFGNSERSTRQLDRVRQMLELYKAVDPAKVRVDYLNPFVDAKDFEALVRRIPDVAASSGDGIVLTYGEGDAAPHAVLGTRELFEGAGDRAEGGPDRFVSTFRGEDVVTSALIRLRQGKRSKVAFTTGHSEPSIADHETSRPGLGLWRARLASVGTDAVEVNLVRDEVPVDASMLVIVAPKSPFRPDEVERIKAYLTRNGPILAILGNADPSGLEDLLRTYNVEFAPGLAVDPRFNFRKQPFLIYAPVPQVAANLPIVPPIAGRVVLMMNSTPMDVLGAPPKPGSPAPSKPANPALMAVPFLRTGPESWAEVDPSSRPVARDPKRDAGGPLNVGVAVMTRPATGGESPTPRMVVLSSPHAADNQVLQVEPTNLDLLMNAVYWLRGKPELAGIAPTTHQGLLFAADPGLQLRLVMVPTLMAFVLIIGLGATTYLARRD